ncbi:MAG: hypothetical protein RL885_30610 [Planctomycetota bacterium]
MTTEKLTLAAYGKLPLSKEFLRVGCVGAGPVAFKDWVDVGFSSTAEVHRDAPPDWYRRVLFLEPEGREAVVASIRDSSDEGGERRFPFAVFVTLKSRPLRSLAVGGLAFALEPFWEMLEDRNRDLASASDLSSLHRELSATVKVSWDSRSAERQYTFSARSCPFLRWAVGLPGNSLASATTLLWRVRNLFRRLRMIQDPSQSLAVRVPTSESVSLLVQTDLWLNLVARHLGVSQRLPFLALTPGEMENGSLAIISRPLLEKDFAVLPNDGTRAVAGLVDLCAPESDIETDGFAEFSRAISRELGRSDVMLSHLCESPLLS